jgi:hypothetical protein
MRGPSHVVFETPALGCPGSWPTPTSPSSTPTARATGASWSTRAATTATVRTCKTPLDLGLAGGDVWVPCNGDCTLERIDAASAKVTGKLSLKPGIFVAQEAFGDLWVLRSSNTQVWRIKTAG